MRTVERTDDAVKLIDQRLLPGELKILTLTTASEVAEAIRSLAVRGAPAIGVTAAYGLWLAARQESAARGEAAEHEAAQRSARDAAFYDALERAAEQLRATRPTAVNLFWAIERVMRVVRALREAGEPAAATTEAIRVEADRMAEEDVSSNRYMAELGAALIQDGAGVLTHCNTGALATVDIGTALGVITTAHKQGKKFHVYIDETRPVLQGSRLTAWECVRAGVPATLITDNMAAHFMRQGKIHRVFVGADRIAANGDTANKIGTYGVAVLAKAHHIPFYVVAPWSTVDMSLASGEEIVIEERKSEEVTHIGGVRIAPEGIGVANPAFDVTPHELITAIITDRGIIDHPDSETMRKAAERAEGGVPRA